MLVSYEVVDAAYVDDAFGIMPIIDVRDGDEFIAGHIPGAVNVSFHGAQASTKGVGAALVEAFEAEGIKPDTPVIVYCLGGVRAHLSCDYLSERGYAQLRCYEGSFKDWSSDPSRPVEK